MAGEALQKKMDALVEDLALTLDEREYLYARRRSDRRARRVVNLLQEAVDCRSWKQRRPVLELLVPAVQELRSQMRAERMVVPEGFELVPEETLEALREMAVCAVQMYGESSPVAKSTLFTRMGILRARVLNLDAVVAAEAGESGGAEEGKES